MAYTPPKKAFAAWYSDKGGADVNSYAYNFFVSYNRADESAARALALELASHGYRVFFAPESLVHENASRPDDNFWSSILQRALVGSCHFVAIPSEPYLTSDWAGGLELRGFLNIHAVNPERKIALATEPTSPPLEAALASHSVARKDILKWAHSCTSVQPFQLGDPREPNRCFDRLPLEELSVSRGWDDTPLHHRIEPDYQPFEDCVREMMMILRCGASDEHIMARYSHHKWTAWDYENALRDAKHLISHGVSPYSLSIGQLRSAGTSEVGNSCRPIGNSRA